MKKKKTLPFKIKSSDNMLEEFDYEKYCELVEEGLNDEDIARELNINQKLLMNLKKEAEQDY
ncbi:hypothetical protein FDN13_03160 [Caloramator sp. E03]|uniref:hypothetical protein n=1 Tax=Caloramator sp. E03 TaxID=2576307 RepID=UPI001110DBD0|nr:hypothetical protein [Caloramator sp. E03]QCX32784.1 hypothetical protein FDN13_03160 [Caloramator sp. E03]